MYGKGISREGSLLDVGVDLGIVKKSGAWFTYEGEQLGQGRENAKKFLAENLEIMVEISEKVRQEVGIDATGDAESTPRSTSTDADDESLERRAAEPIGRRRASPCTAAAGDAPVARDGAHRQHGRSQPAPVHEAVQVLAARQRPSERSAGSRREREEHAVQR